MDRELDVAFLIADLAGYTALTEAHGGVEAARIIERFVALADRALRSGVDVLERVGDALVLTATEPLELVRTAIAIGAAVAREPMFPGVRIGMHMGPVVLKGGHYYGSALNLTARIAAHARPGQILGSGTIAALCTGSDAVRCRALGPVHFKNVPGAVDVFEVQADERSTRTDPDVDPVCQMHVGSTEPAARIPYEGRTYVFCSVECASAFAAAPDAYLPERAR
jgi:adenylate cyclase